MSKPQWKVAVTETREVVCEYVVEGDTEEEARQNAESGETIQERWESYTVEGRKAYEVEPYSGEEEEN